MPHPSSFSSPPVLESLDPGPTSHSHAFASALLESESPARLSLRAWQRVPPDPASPPRCAFCCSPPRNESPLSAHVQAVLLPPALGGPDVEENRVVSCRSCLKLRGKRDPLAWPAFAHLGSEDSRSAVLALRRHVLLRSNNHLVHAPAMAPRARVEHELEKRFAHPRFLVHAAVGETQAWVGWSNRFGSPDTLGSAALLLRTHGEATHERVGEVEVFSLSSVLAREALWLLIEHHAIVQRLHLGGVEQPKDAEDWTHHWDLLLPRLEDLRRRRPLARTTTDALVVAPYRGRELSTNGKVAARRERRRKDAAWARGKTFDEARAALDRFKEDVRLGLVEEPSPGEWLAMEAQVLVLLDSRSRKLFSGF